jgi:hypothetical protein
MAEPHIRYVVVDCSSRTPSILTISLEQPRDAFLPLRSERQSDWYRQLQPTWYFQVLRLNEYMSQICVYKVQDVSIIGQVQMLPNN